jgi:hypothetical protein
MQGIRFFKETPKMARPLTILVVVVAMAIAGDCTNAETLTFDGLPSVYTAFSGYQEKGYNFSMTPGSGWSILHIGDGTQIADTLNWHDGGDNGLGSYMTMTRIGGGTFDLYDLDVQGDYIDVVGFYRLSVGHHTALNILGVTSLVFNTSNNGGGIDNLHVGSSSAVPEIDPNSFGSAFTLVLGALGLLERRARARVA